MITVIRSTMRAQFTAPYTGPKVGSGAACNRASRTLLLTQFSKFEKNGSSAGPV